MKHVTFTRDMRPQHAGDRRIVPDDVAVRLEAEGAIEPGPPEWPAAKPSVPIVSPDPRQVDRRGKHRYPTK